MSELSNKPVLNIDACLDALSLGKVIAYPTEGVFGVGCDPDNEKAIQLLLNVKEREKNKGLILIASDVEQLRNYVNFDAISPEMQAQIFSTWPGPVTWVVPKTEKTSDWVSGVFDTVAVRVSDHPDVKALCRQYGKPITSTSANLSGQPPCLTAQEVESHLGERVSCILYGQTGGRMKPTEIRDGLTGNILRQG